MISNEYDRWPPLDNYAPPAISDRWQRELIRIAGLTPNRLPMLRLEWGSTCTWTPYTKNLKYLAYVRDRQVGWLLDIKDRETDTVVRRFKFPLNMSESALLQARATAGPTEYAGLPYPQMVLKEEVGIPRFWIAQYTPPSLIGSWDEARRRVEAETTDDMGAFPREGIYYLGFHPIWDHDSARKCCSLAREERRKCFGYFRPPSDLDMTYVAALWRENLREYSHAWTDAPTAKEMEKNLMRLVDKHQDIARKEREEAKLRIRDIFKTHKDRYTSRKGKSTWIFTPAGPV